MNDTRELAIKSLSLLRGEQDDSLDLGAGSPSQWSRIDARLRKLSSWWTPGNSANRDVVVAQSEVAALCDEDWLHRQLLSAWRREIALLQLLAETPTAERACPDCGCEALVIVKSLTGCWEVQSFDRHPDREGIEENDTDWESDCERHLFALACPKCREVVNGTEWVE